MGLIQLQLRQDGTAVSGMRVIGAADEFWRLRLTRVDATGAPDFEWREDVLYRAPSVEQPKEAESWNIEAIGTEDYETVILVASFDQRPAAEAYLERVASDLAEMTKNQFEESYLSPSASAKDETDS